MHDPNTLAFEIKRPWKTRGNFPYRPSILNVWHVDPEIDGTDDSCGWSSPKLTKAELDKVKLEVESELKWWFLITGETMTAKVSAEAIVFQAFKMLAWRIFRKKLRAKHMPEILSLMYNSFDNFSDSFRNPNITKDDAIRTCYFIARAFKRMERKWWQHPRWHILHWRIYVPLFGKFNRWAFSRCAKCGGRFSWGYSPTTNSWNGSGPRFLRGEPGVFHGDCDSAPFDVAKA